MNKTKKSLISIMCAMSLAGTAMTGCDDKVETENSEPTYGFYTTKEIGKNLIVALTEKNVTLHKADVYAVRSSNGDASVYMIKKVVTKCMSSEDAEIGILTEQITIYPSMPNENAYDEICHECFQD